MRCFEIALAERYSFLAREAAPRLVGYLQEKTRSGEARPAVLVLPGGGYTHYGTMEGDAIALQFMREGYQAFVLYYSLSPYAYPQQILDVAAAMDHITANAVEYGLDPDKIVQIGFSAGGHLAASYATFCHRPEIAAHIAARPAGAVILSYALLTGPHACLCRLAGKEALSEEEYSYLSPLSHISKEHPPTFLWHTAEDRSVPVSDSLRYAEALCAHGVNTEIHVFPKGPHALSTGGWATVADPHGEAARSVSAWVPLAMRWLEFLFRL